MTTISGSAQAQAGDGGKTPVTVADFSRAESDRYFADVVRQAGLGKLYHYRTPPSIDHQTVVRMNRDTLYSGAVPRSRPGQDHPSRVGQALHVPAGHQRGPLSTMRRPR